MNLGKTVFFVPDIDLASKINNLKDCNPLSFEDPCVAIIVKDWGDRVNLKVLLDGKENIWVTSVPHGSAPGEYHFPEERNIGMHSPVVDTLTGFKGKVISILESEGKQKQFEVTSISITPGMLLANEWFIADRLELSQE